MMMSNARVTQKVKPTATAPPEQKVPGSEWALASLAGPEPNPPSLGLPLSQTFSQTLGQALSQTLDQALNQTLGQALGLPLSRTLGPGVPLKALTWACPSLPSTTPLALPVTLSATCPALR